MFQTFTQIKLVTHNFCPLESITISFLPRTGIPYSSEEDMITKLWILALVYFVLVL